MSEIFKRYLELECGMKSNRFKTTADQTEP